MPVHCGPFVHGGRAGTPGERAAVVRFLPLYGRHTWLRSTSSSSAGGRSDRVNAAGRFTPASMPRRRPVWSRAWLVATGEAGGGSTAPRVSSPATAPCGSSGGTCSPRAWSVPALDDPVVRGPSVVVRMNRTEIDAPAGSTLMPAWYRFPETRNCPQGARQLYLVVLGLRSQPGVGRDRSGVTTGVERNDPGCVSGRRGPQTYLVVGIANALLVRMVPLEVETVRRL